MWRRAWFWMDLFIVPRRAVCRWRFPIYTYIYILYFGGAFSEQQAGYVCFRIWDLCSGRPGENIRNMDGHFYARTPLFQKRSSQHLAVA